jgi:hypothetical protein
MSSTTVASSPAIRRLNALMAAGYEIDTAASQKVVDALWLYHPATRRAKEESLILGEDGLVVGDSTRDAPQLRLYPADTTRFADFVRTVPRPTAWERAWQTRAALFGWAWLLGFMFAVYGFVAFLVWLFTHD